MKENIQLLFLNIRDLDSHLYDS